MISSESRVPEPIPKTRFNLSHINIVLLQSSITGIICGFPVIKVYHTLYSNKIKITFSVSAGILFHLISWFNLYPVTLKLLLQGTCFHIHPLPFFRKYIIIISIK